MLFIENLDLVELNYVKLQCAATSLDWLSQVGNIMSFQDPISDCLTRIRNGLMRGKKVVYAGYLENIEEAKRSQSGIPLHKEVVDWFKKISNELNTESL